MDKSANRLLPLAKVVKAFGTHGELIIKTLSAEWEKFNTKEPVFIFFDGLPVPFFIDNQQPKGRDRLLVSMSSIDSLNLATEIEGELIYYQNNERVGNNSGNEDFSLSSLIGFSLFTPEGEKIGTVSHFHDYPGNPCIEIISAEENREHLLPIHTDLIVSFDLSKRRLILSLPKGILNI